MDDNLLFTLGFFFSFCPCFIAAAGCRTVFRDDFKRFTDGDQRRCFDKPLTRVCYPCVAVIIFCDLFYRLWLRPEAEASQTETLSVVAFWGTWGGLMVGIGVFFGIFRRFTPKKFEEDSFNVAHAVYLREVEKWEQEVLYVEEQLQGATETVTVTIQPAEIEMTVPKSYHVGHILKKLPYAEKLPYTVGNTSDVLPGSIESEEEEEAREAREEEAAREETSQGLSPQDRAKLTFGGFELDEIQPMSKSRRNLDDLDLENGAVLYLTGATLCTSSSHFTVPPPIVVEHSFEAPQRDDVRFFSDVDVLEWEHLQNCRSYRWICSEGEACDGLLPGCCLYSDRSRRLGIANEANEA